MSKSFENELNTMLDNEIPDLWSRIEPQLHDKKVSDTISFENAVEATKISVNDKSDNNKSANKKTVSNIRKFIPLIGSLAAACALVAIIIPAVRVMNNTNSTTVAESSSNSSHHNKEEDGWLASNTVPSATTDAAAAEAADEAPNLAEEVPANSDDYLIDGDFGEVEETDIGEADDGDLIINFEHLTYTIPEYLLEYRDHIIIREALVDDGSKLGSVTEDTTTELYEDAKVYYAYIYVDSDLGLVYCLAFDETIFSAEEAEIIGNSAVIK